MAFAAGPSGAAAPKEPEPDIEALRDLDLLLAENFARERDLLTRMPVLERLRMLERLHLFESEAERVPATNKEKSK
jgi:hypothetical protein